jgi:Holliday junction resolvase
MGKASRDKGKRGEYNLRDYLRKQEWKADRVPSSGAAQGFKGDVKATHAKHGEKLFELKCRKETFKKIYELYYAHVAKAGDDLLAVAMPEPGMQHVCVNISTSLEAVLGGADHHVLPQHHPLYAQYGRTFRKIANLEKLLGESDILVLRDDRQAFLFIRFI